MFKAHAEGHGVVLAEEALVEVGRAGGPGVLVLVGEEVLHEGGSEPVRGVGTLQAVDEGDGEGSDEVGVRLNPKSAEAYLARGGSYHQLGMHEKGLADRAEAIRLAPKMAEAWLARGSAYYLLGNYQDAVIDLKEALLLKPEDQEARSVLLKSENAIARGGAPEPQVRTVMAEIRTPQRPVPEVQIPDAGPPAVGLVQVINAMPSHPEVSHVEAKPVATSHIDAVSHVDLAAAAPPPATTPARVPAPAVKAPVADKLTAAQHNQRGRELTAAGKYREAIAELDLAIRAQPDFWLAYNARGYAYHLLRDYARAIADYEEAIRLNPKYENAIHNREAAVGAQRAASQRTLTAQK